MSTEQTQQYARGTLIVIEGGDGTGKSTASKLLREELQKMFPDVPVRAHRLPDGKVRDILLNRTETIPMNAELMLYLAGHLILMENEVKPALDRGEIVVLDRYYYSTIAYQGYGRDNLRLATDIAANVIEVHPDMVIFTRSTYSACKARIMKRGSMDFMDKESDEFHQRTHAGFEDIADHMHRYSDKFTPFFLYNDGTFEDLHNRVKRIVASWQDAESKWTPPGLRDHLNGLKVKPVPAVETVNDSITASEAAPQDDERAALEAKVAEFDDLVSCLHHDQNHPNYQYESTLHPVRTDNPQSPPGEGWEVNVDLRGGLTRYQIDEFHHWRRLKSCSKTDPANPFDSKFSNLEPFRAAGLREYLKASKLQRVIDEAIQFRINSGLGSGRVIHLDSRDHHENGYYVYHPTPLCSNLNNRYLLINAGDIRILYGTDDIDILVSAKNPAGVWSTWVSWCKNGGIWVNPLPILNAFREFLENN